MQIAHQSSLETASRAVTENSSPWRCCDTWNGEYIGRSLTTATLNACRTGVRGVRSRSMHTTCSGKHDSFTKNLLVLRFGASREEHNVTRVKPKRRVVRPYYGDAFSNRYDIKSGNSARSSGGKRESYAQKPFDHLHARVRMCVSTFKTYGRGDGLGAPHAVRRLSQSRREANLRDPWSAHGSAKIAPVQPVPYNESVSLLRFGPPLRSALQKGCCIVGLMIQLGFGSSEIFGGLQSAGQCPACGTPIVHSQQMRLPPDDDGTEAAVKMLHTTTFTMFVTGGLVRDIDNKLYAPKLDVSGAS